MEVFVFASRFLWTLPLSDGRLTGQYTIGCNPTRRVFLTDSSRRGPYGRQPVTKNTWSPGCCYQLCWFATSKAQRTYFRWKSILRFWTIKVCLTLTFNHLHFFKSILLSKIGPENHILWFRHESPPHCLLSQLIHVRFSHDHSAHWAALRGSNL